VDLTAWHALSLDGVYRRVSSSEEGLSQTEAEGRLARNGPNSIAAGRGAPMLKKLLDQFVQPLVVVLIVAGVVSAVLGDYVDAAVIGGVVVANALIGFVQEFRAERAIAALGKTITAEASVLRDGVLQRLPSEQ
jgi:magnesium-transporting ATPase (P-type)